MTSLGRKVGRNLGKSLKTSLPRESLLSLPFSSRAGFTFVPLSALGLYAGGTCRNVVPCQANAEPVTLSGEYFHLRLLRTYTNLPLRRIVLLLGLACFLDRPSLSPCPPVTDKQPISS